MISTTMRNNLIFRKILKTFSATAFWILIWEAASLFVGENLKLFLPSPFAVIKKWGELCITADFWRATAATVARIFAGFILGSIAGILCGIFTSSSKIADTLLSPALRVIRAVPVVSFIILAFLFIDVDFLPVFISFLMVIPMIWQTVHDGLNSTDKKLIEMGQVFGLSSLKILLSIKLPLLTGEIISVCVSGLGFAWKSGVAAEVLSNPNISIGRSIYRAKGNLEFDEVYALTLTVVLLSIIIEILLKRLCQAYLSSKQEAADDRA